MSFPLVRPLILMIYSAEVTDNHRHGQSNYEHSAKRANPTDNFTCDRFRHHISVSARKIKQIRFVVIYKILLLCVCVCDIDRARLSFYTCIKLMQTPRRKSQYFTSFYRRGARFLCNIRHTNPPPPYPLSCFSP